MKSDSFSWWRVVEASHPCVGGRDSALERTSKLYCWRQHLPWQCPLLIPFCLLFQQVFPAAFEEGKWKPLSAISGSTWSLFSGRSAGACGTAGRDAAYYLVAAWTTEGLWGSPGCAFLFPYLLVEVNINKKHWLPQVTGLKRVYMSPYLTCFLLS